MSVARKSTGRRVVRWIHGIINLAVLVFALLMIAFGGYALWDSEQIYQAAAPEQYEVYKPQPEEEGGGLSFQEIQRRNPDVFAWLTVYGTNINYPVAQGEDDMEYINTNALGEYSLSGSLFLDSSNKKDFTDFRSIIYGHQMEENMMFGEIDFFAEKAFFDTRPYGNLFYEGKDHGLEFFAYLHVDAYDSTVYGEVHGDQERRQTYLSNLFAKAALVRDIGVTTEDQLVLLSTCSTYDTNGRDIVAARLTEQTYADIFMEKETDKDQGTGTDALQNIFSRWWLWIVILILVILFLMIVVFNKWRKRRRF